MPEVPQLQPSHRAAPHRLEVGAQHGTAAHAVVEGALQDGGQARVWSKISQLSATWRVTQGIKAVAGSCLSSPKRALGQPLSRPACLQLRVHAGAAGHHAVHPHQLVEVEVPAWQGQQYACVYPCKAMHELIPPFLQAACSPAADSSQPCHAAVPWPAEWPPAWRIMEHPKCQGKHSPPN